MRRQYGTNSCYFTRGYVGVTDGEMVRELDVNAISVGAVFRGLDCHIVDIKKIATQ